MSTIKRPIFIYLQRLKYFHRVRTKISPTGKNNEIYKQYICLYFYI